MSGAAKEKILSGSHDVIARVAMLEEQMRGVHARNQRVELHKSWETSWARVISLTLITYVTMILVFYMLGRNDPLVQALVPTAGFFLSTLPLPFVRRVWEKRVDDQQTG